MSNKQPALQMTESREDFVPITGNPYHDDIVCIREALIPLILQSGYNKDHAKPNLWVIITSANAYAKKYDGTFVTTKCIGTYPPILQDAIDQTWKIEAVWKICIEDYALYDAGVRGIAAFTLSVVDDVWVHELHNPTTFIPM